MKQYGQKVALLRSLLGYTQQDLAFMLGCDQATISKIERGELRYGETVHNVGWKLGISVRDFFDTHVNQLEDFDYVKETKQYIRSLVDKRKYQSVAYYLKECWKSMHFQSMKDQVFLHWHQGIVDLHDQHKPTLAKTHLEEALKLSSCFETLINRAEVLNSYGILHCVTGDIESSLYYLTQAEKLLSNLEFGYTSQIYTRILYNMSNTYFHLHQYKTSQQKAFKAIQVCKESKSTYLRGEVTYQYGYSTYQLGFKEEAKQYIETSVLYLLDNDEEEMAKYVVQQLHELDF